MAEQKETVAFEILEKQDRENDRAQAVRDARSHPLKLDEPVDELKELLKADDTAEVACPPAPRIASAMERAKADGLKRQREARDREEAKARVEEAVRSPLAGASNILLGQRAATILAGFVGTETHEGSLSRKKQVELACRMARMIEDELERPQPELQR